MLGEELLEMLVGKRECVVEQLLIAHRREIGSVCPQLVHFAFVAEYVRQARRGQNPAERLTDPCGEVGAVEALLDNELGNTGSITEERSVDVLGRHPRRTMPKHPQRRRIEVGVPAGHAKENALVVVKVLVKVVLLHVATKELSRVLVILRS